MIYHSTRNEQLTASSTHAVLQGIAPDGGLYICDPAALHFDWRAALEKDTLPAIGGEDGRRTIELITAIYKSGATKQTVTLPLFPLQVSWPAMPPPSATLFSYPIRPL